VFKRNSQGQSASPVRRRLVTGAIVLGTLGASAGAFAAVTSDGTVSVTGHTAKPAVVNGSGVVNGDVWAGTPCNNVTVTFRNTNPRSMTVKHLRNGAITNVSNPATASLLSEVPAAAVQQYVQGVVVPKNSSKTVVLQNAVCLSKKATNADTDVKFTANYTVEGSFATDGS